MRAWEPLRLGAGTQACVCVCVCVVFCFFFLLSLSPGQPMALVTSGWPAYGLFFVSFLSQAAETGRGAIAAAMAVESSVVVHASSPVPVKSIRS